MLFFTNQKFITYIMLLLAMCIQRSDVLANVRYRTIEPISKSDFRNIPAGAAIWFHKAGKYWFYLVIGGHGYMRIDNGIRKFIRIAPKGQSWSCEAMRFQLASSRTGSAKIYQEGKTWTINFNIDTQTKIIGGLTCSSGS